MYCIIVLFARFLGQLNCFNSSDIQSTLKFDEIVSSLLSEEMREKTMDNHSMYALYVRGRPQERKKIKDLGDI